MYSRIYAPSLKPGGDKNTVGVSEMMKDLSIENRTNNNIPRRNTLAVKEEGNIEQSVPVNTFETRLIEKSDEISVQDRRELRSDTINYDAQRMIGHGSFGAVFLAKVVETNEIVAIKKVLQDKRFKNRELLIMRQLVKQPHPYIVGLRHHFSSKGSKTDDVYLNLVLEYVPETIYSLGKHFNRSKESFPLISIKVYMYQLARALGHIHGMGICHRDIKPQNLLVDPVRHVLKLCDFGSAKALVRGEPNIAYICSRYYRAPELIFGSTDYTSAIDVWSQGCVLAEMITGTPIFPGSSGVDQLVEIIKVLGTPTKDELKSMNPNYQEFKFPQIRAHPWTSIFRPQSSPEAIELVKMMLTYVPTKRCKAIEACGHQFFNCLRDRSTVLPTGLPPPPEMFTFTTEELFLAPEMEQLLTPSFMGNNSSLEAQNANNINNYSDGSMSVQAPGSSMTAEELFSTGINSNNQRIPSRHSTKSPAAPITRPNNKSPNGKSGSSSLSAV